MTASGISAEIDKAIQTVLESWFGEAIEHMEDEKRVRKYLLEPLCKAAQPSASAQCLRPCVSIRPMALSDGRTDYFVSIKVGDRDVTPHVFREEYKAAYHVALYDWLLNGAGEEPCPIDFKPEDYPACRTPAASVEPAAWHCPACEAAVVIDDSTPAAATNETFETSQWAPIRKMRELLKDPVAVHVNMLRGAIAKPSLANIKHLYPEIQQAFEQVESLRGILADCVSPDWRVLTSARAALQNPSTPPTPEAEQ